MTDNFPIDLVVVKAQAGCIKSFEQLYRRFELPLLTFITKLVGSNFADDVSQIVWLNAYRTIANLHSPAAFKSWLFRLGTNASIDHFRKHGREPETEQFIEDAISSDSLPLLDTKSFIDDVQRYIKLSTNDGTKEAFSLYYMKGFSLEQISQVSQVSVNTVKTRIRAVRLILMQRNPLSIGDYYD